MIESSGEMILEISPQMHGARAFTESVLVAEPVVHHEVRLICSVPNPHRHRLGIAVQNAIGGQLNTATVVGRRLLWGGPPPTS